MTAEERESEGRLSCVAERFPGLSSAAWVQVQTRWRTRFTPGCSLAEWVWRSCRGTKGGEQGRGLQRLTTESHLSEAGRQTSRGWRRWDQRRVDPGESKDSKRGGISDSKLEREEEQSKRGVCEVEIGAGWWLLVMTETRPGLSEWSRWEVQRTQRPRCQVYLKARADYFVSRKHVLADLAQSWAKY